MPDPRAGWGLGLPADIPDIKAALSLSDIVLESVSLWSELYGAGALGFCSPRHPQNIGHSRKRTSRISSERGKNHEISMFKVKEYFEGD